MGAEELGLGVFRATSLQLNFQRVRPKPGLKKPISLCLCQWNHVGEPHATCAAPPSLVAHSPTALCCFHHAETLPYGVCALLSVHQHDRKVHVTAAHGYNSNVSNVTVNFIALFLLEDLVRMQLLYNS